MLYRKKARKKRQTKILITSTKDANPDTLKDENLLPSNLEVKIILDIIDLQPNIVEMKDLGEF